MNSPPDPIFEIAKILVPAALVVIGWLVLYGNAKSIEKRKEIKSLVDITVKLVDEIAVDGRKYFSKSNPEHIGHLSQRLKTNLTLLAHYLFLIESCDVPFFGSKDLTDFRKVLTGSYFETTDYLKQTTIPGWMAEVAAAEAKLKLSINRSYFAWSGALNRKERPKKKKAAWF